MKTTEVYRVFSGIDIPREWVAERAMLTFVKHDVRTVHRGDYDTGTCYTC